jgi:hypothetical protein
MTGGVAIAIIFTPKVIRPQNIVLHYRSFSVMGGFPRNPLVRLLTEYVGETNYVVAKREFSS